MTLEMDVVLASELEPGRYVCVRTGSLFGYLIRLFTRSAFDHAFVVLAGGKIAEATTRGVRVDDLSAYAGARAAANSAELVPADQLYVVASTARGYAGKEYNWGDIGVIALRRLGAKWKWLLRAADDRDALICSELVCVAGKSAGLDWQCGEIEPEFVTPAELARRRVTVPVVWS